MLVYVRKDWLAACAPCAEVLPPDHLQKRKERELQLQKEHEEEIRIAHLFADVQVAQFSSGAAQEAQHHSGNFAAASELYKLKQQIPIKWSEVPTEKYKREMSVRLLSESETVVLPDGHVWTHWLFHHSRNYNTDILTCIPMGLTFAMVIQQMEMEPPLRLVAIPMSLRDYEQTINQDQNSHLLIYSIFKQDDSNRHNDFGPLLPLTIQKEHTIANVLSYLYHENVPDLTVAKRHNVHSCKVLTDSDLQEHVSKNFMPGEILYIMEEDEVSLRSTNCNILQGHLNQVEVSVFNKKDFPGGYPSSASPPSIQCVLNITMSHDEVCTAICECLGAGNDANPNHPGPEYMQLTAPAYGYAMRHPVPDQSPFLRSTWTTLDATLRVLTKGDTEILFYEFLEYPVRQVEASIYVDVEWLDTVTSVSPVNLRMLLPKGSSLRDVESWIRNPELSKVTLSDAHSKIRYYSYFAGNSTVDKLLIRPNTPLDMIDSHASLVAELVPPDDQYYYQSRQEGEPRSGRLLEVNHVWKNKQGPFAFGMPLLVAYKKNETVAHVMARLQLRLKVEDREWSRWAPARVKKGAVLHEEVEMDDLLDEVLGAFVGAEAWRFGLLHEGSSRRRVRQHIGRSSSLRID